MIPAREALARLIEGNRRFAANTLDVDAKLDPVRRRALAGGDWCVGRNARALSFVEGRSAGSTYNTLDKRYGGESGIRTHGRVSPTHAFQACSFNHSDISPFDRSTLLMVALASIEGRLAALAHDRPREWGQQSSR
jgi:hypothetical protein